MNKSARRIVEVNFVRDYNLSPENLALYRQATGGRLPVSSLLVAKTPLQIAAYATFSGNPIPIP